MPYLFYSLFLAYGKTFLKVNLENCCNKILTIVYTFAINHVSIFVGLLGVAMEFQNTETDFDFRTPNDKLIPIMIKTC